MPRPRVVLIHGAATTSRVWRRVVPLLDGFDVYCPDRPVTGDLGKELDYLAPLCQDALVGGVSGGATLGLALAAGAARAGAGIKAALLHEPAVGSLLPGLLTPMAEAYADGGPEAFGKTLYGPAWTPDEAPADLEAVGRDLAMFRTFEPQAPKTSNVVITTGALSPPVRHESVRRLAKAFALPVVTLPGTAHAVHLENPAAFAAEIRQLAENSAA